MTRREPGGAGQIGSSGGTAGELPAPRSRWQRAAPLGVFVVMLCVFTLTASPGIGTADTAKFQFVGRLLGTPHAPGYPTYVILSALFERAIPFGTSALRANLLSGVFAAAAVVCLFVALRRLLRHHAAALAAALCFGLLPTVWRLATEAEVYSLNLFFLAAVTALLLRWHHGEGERWLTAAFLAYALSFGNHLTVVCLGPAMLVFLLLTGRPAVLRPRRLVTIGAFAAVGALQYGVIVWRTFDPSAAYLETQANTLGELLYNLRGAQHRFGLFGLSVREVVADRLPWLAARAGRELAPLLPFLLLGLRGLPRRVGLFLGLALGGYLVFLSLYTVADLELFMHPLYLFACFPVGAGLDRVAAWLGQRLGRRASASLIVVPGLLAALNLGTFDRQTGAIVERRVRQVLTAAPSPSVVLSCDYQQSMALTYGALLGDPPPGRQTIVHVPPRLLRLPFSLDPLMRHLLGAAGMRVGPRDELLPFGTEMFVPGESFELQQALAARGVAATPVAEGVTRLTAASSADPAPSVAFLVHRLDSVTGLAEALAVLGDPSFEVRGRAVRLARSSGSVQYADPPAPEAVVVRRWDGSVIEVGIEAASPGWLVVADTFRALWQAGVDGVRCDAFRADLIFVALEVPPGHHEVRLERRTGPFSLATWLGLTPSYLVP